MELFVSQPAACYRCHFSSWSSSSGTEQKCSNCSNAGERVVECWLKLHHSSLACLSSLTYASECTVFQTAYLYLVDLCTEIYVVRSKTTVMSEIIYIKTNKKKSYIVSLRFKVCKMVAVVRPHKINKNQLHMQRALLFMQTFLSTVQI
jgi:hypothetical protein